MANGEVAITFDGVDLDHCIKQGLEVQGQAKCPHCKQIYSFQIHLNLKEKTQKYTETEIDGKMVTTLVPDSYNVSIEFSKVKGPLKAIDLLAEEEKSKKKPK
jgi:phage FluMu protein Com